ncbi:putative transporter [alpha proteobacterium Q-1]|nr:putative transporter [alpha proteobacterium Q-1]
MLDNVLVSIQPAFGLAVLIGIAWLFSEDRRAFSWRWVVGAVLLQIVLAFLFLRVPMLWKLLEAAGEGVMVLEQASRAGSSYMFGYLGGAPLPFEAKAGASTLIIAFEILPIILVTAALSALLWHWRILPAIIRGLGWALQRSLGIGGAVGLGTAANLFMGVVESPLVLRAYVRTMGRAEIFMVMVAGLATVSGVVLVLYATLIEPVVPGATGHILTASLISLPAALLFARLMIPGDSATGAKDFDQSVRYASSLDALVRGTEDGLKVFLSVMAMLIVVFALVYLANAILGLAPEIGGAPLSLDRLFGWIFAPIVFLFGVPWSEAGVAGQLMGTKAVLNEFIAYQALSELPAGALSQRSSLIMVYAMCGFANLASIGLQVATFATLAPERRAEIAALGPKAWLAGNLATGATGAIAGLVLF